MMNPQNQNQSYLGEEELSNINGGSWGEIVGTGLGGATVGVKVCKSFGVGAAVACGVGGALIGASVGYIFSD